MKQVLLQATPSQTVSTIIADLNCTINVYHKTTGLYLDLLIDGNPVVLGRICLDRCLLVRYEYLGFPGDLVFVDSQGKLDPVYTGLADRFQLIYLEPSEI